MIPGSFPRPYQLPEGGFRTVWLPACSCGPTKRGPEGGVCGACGYAILDAAERIRLGFTHASPEEFGETRLYLTLHEKMER